MASRQLSSVLRELRRIALGGGQSGASDGQLLNCFLEHGDQAAFEILVKRHGRMVWGVCLRVLHHVHDAEDSFQATFLVFARKATSIRKRESVASWLHGAAYRAALEAKAARRPKEKQVPIMPEPEAPIALDPWAELRPLFDRELNRISQKYRGGPSFCASWRERPERKQPASWPSPKERSRDGSRPLAGCWPHGYPAPVWPFRARSWQP
jgi:RNA polymerase sigma-70 factor (ECF subfamily)